MPLLQQLQEEMKAAMKNKEAVRLSVIRMIKAACMNAEIAKGAPLDDGEVLQIIAKELKQRQDALPDYQRAGRPEMLTRLNEEIALIKSYLPQPLTEDELKAVIRETIAETGAAGPKDIGKVMSVLMPKVRGRADGQVVNRLLRELLA